MKLCIQLDTRMTLACTRVKYVEAMGGRHRSNWLYKNGQWACGNLLISLPTHPLRGRVHIVWPGESVVNSKCRHVLFMTPAVGLLTHCRPHVIRDIRQVLGLSQVDILVSNLFYGPKKPNRSSTLKVFLNFLVCVIRDRCLIRPLRSWSETRFKDFLERRQSQKMKLLIVVVLLLNRGSQSWSCGWVHLLIHVVIWFKISKEGGKLGQT